MSAEPIRFLPYGRQTIEEDDIAAVAKVLRGDWLTTGPAVAAFEEAFARAVGAVHAVSCSNGTAALHLAAMAQGLGAGDRAIVPAVTFLATANAIRMVGAEVVFADVNPDNGLLTPHTLEAAVARLSAAERASIKAVLPVHLAGQLCDMAGIDAIARSHGWTVIEDACHALGGAYAGGAPIGGGANMGCFSFHPVKTIASGEGGMVTTPDARLAERLARLRNHGMVREPAAWADRSAGIGAGGAPNPWYYEMPEVGYNYRLTDFQAALAQSQLAKLPRFVQRRDALVARYNRGIAELAPAIRPIARSGIGRPAWHLYAVLVDFPALGLDRAALMAQLRERGIGSQVHYIPLPRQPYYRRRYGKLDLQGAEAYYGRCLSLPLYAGMADSDVDRVVAALTGIVRP